MLDISSQDNLRPKVQEIHCYSDYLGYDNVKMKAQKDKNSGVASLSARNSYTGYSSNNFNREQGSAISYAESKLQVRDTNEKAFSSYKMSLKKDGENSFTEGEKVSSSVQLSSQNTQRIFVADKKDLTPDKHTVKFHAHAKSGPVSRDDTLTDREHFTFSSSMLRSRHNKEVAQIHLFIFVFIFCFVLFSEVQSSILQLVAYRI